MKKVLFLLGATLLFASCSETTDEVPSTKYATLTFEDADYTAAANYQGESNWSSLIDIEYGGDLLYALDEYWTGYSEYAWSDANNTELASEIVYSDGGTAFWNGGIAVSNYYLAVSEDSQAGYDRQLSIPYINSNGNSGYNGSENFAVVFNGGYLYFGDDVARTIDGMFVAPTSYWMSVALYGDYSTTAMTSSDWFKITATSVDSVGSTLASTELYLAQGGEILDGWNYWDLSVLGDVTKVVFTAEGSIYNDYGSALPGYFAIDNVVVKME